MKHTLMCLIFAASLPVAAAKPTWWEQLKALEAKPAATGGELQNLAALRTFAGDVQGAQRAYDQQLPSPAMPGAGEAEALAGAAPEEAIQAIVRAAKDRRVVILNEAHHVPMHRAFAMRLARELRKAGFYVLACEAFTVSPLAPGYVYDDTGYYTSDPMFANFVRDALADGWKLASYEDYNFDPKVPPMQSIRKRERAQAQNLADLLRRDPDARVFVYAGYGHAKKAPLTDSEAGAAYMAGHLKTLSGIDPLTIDQTTMFARSKPELEFGLYRQALALAPSKAAFVLRAKDGSYLSFASYRGVMDMAVVHPPSTIDPATGRADWLGGLAQMHPHVLPEDLMPKSGQRLIEARIAGQKDDAVPVDAVLVNAGQPAPKLMLPAGGSYRYSTRD